MISKFSHKVFRLYLTWANLIHVFPYTYNKEKCCIELSSKIHIWFVVSSLVIGHALFTMGRIFQDFFFNNGRAEDFLFRFFFIAAYGLALTNQLNSLKNYKELSALMTMYLRFDKIYSERYEVHRNLDMLGLFMGFLFPCIVMSHETLYIGIYIFNPKSPNYLNSFLDTEPYSKESFLMLIPEMVFFIYCWTSVYWSLLVVFTFQMSANYWLKQISSEHSASETTRAALRKPEVAMRAYREIRILTRMFNNTMAHIYQPLHSIFMSGCFITCAFATIHCYGSMHWFVYILNPVTAVSVVVYDCISYSTAAGILAHSEEFLHSWQKSVSSFSQTELQKFLQSCPSLKILMGGQFHIQKKTLFTCLNIMINQTIAILVGIR